MLTAMVGRSLIAALILASAWCASASAQAPAATVDDGWRGAFMGSEGLVAADGLGSVRLPGDRILWLLGDSIIGTVKDGRVQPGAAMSRNAILVCPAGPDSPAPDAVQRLWGPKPAGNRTGWVTPEGTGEGPLRWCWPVGGAVLLDGPTTGPESHPRLLIFYADMGEREAGATDCWNFRQVGNRLAVVENPADAPADWKVGQRVIWSGRPEGARQINWGSAVMLDPRPEPGKDADLLVFGTDGTDVMNKKAVLARAPRQRPDDFSAWRFWTGEAWSDKEADAAAVAADISDEFSIHALPGPGGPALIMVHTEGRLGRKVLARTAGRPEGPWSDPRTLYEAPEPAATQGVFVYGAKAHPEIAREGELALTYCVNSTDFAAVLGHIAHYRPRFFRVPLGALDRPPAPPPRPAAPTAPTER